MCGVCRCITCVVFVGVLHVVFVGVLHVWTMYNTHLFSVHMTFISTHILGIHLHSTCPTHVVYV